MNKKETAAMAVADQQIIRRDRVVELQRKLKARTGNPAHKENCQAIIAEINRLQTLIADVDGASA